MNRAGVRAEASTDPGQLIYSASSKEWRRVATRYDRCAHTFLSAISIGPNPLLLAVINES